MTSFFTLFIICIAMFCGSFLAGHLPLSFSLSKRALHHTSVFGAGLIVSTAFVIILPEGFQTLISSSSIQPNPTSPPQPQPPNSPLKTLDSSSDQDHKHNPQFDFTIGSSLLAGFLMMFIIEQIQARTLHFPHTSNYDSFPSPIPTTDPEIINLDQFGTPINRLRSPLDPHLPQFSSSVDIVQDARHAHINTPNVDLNHLHEPVDPSYSSKTGRTVLNATIVLFPFFTNGLVIHSFSDGVAMGAAAVHSQPSLETAIFLAILLHKAPSAFGLTSYLLHHRMISTHRIRFHLLAFSIAAPLAACTTFLALRGAHGSPESIAMWTGILLLFSAGSFIYVATVHILPDVLSRGGGHLSNLCVMFMLLGMLLPLFMQVNHHH